MSKVLKVPSKSKSKTKTGPLKVLRKSTTTVASRSSKKRRKVSEESKRLRPKIKTSAAFVAKKTAAEAAVTTNRERLSRCSSYGKFITDNKRIPSTKKDHPHTAVPPKSKRHKRLFIAPAFSDLHVRLKVSSNLGRNYSVVDLVTPADQQTIRWAFTRTVGTCILSLLLFTVLTMGLFAGLLPSGYVHWPGVLQSSAATIILCLSVTLFSYWTNVSSLTKFLKMKAMNTDLSFFSSTLRPSSTFAFSPSWRWLSWWALFYMAQLAASR